MIGTGHAARRAFQRLGLALAEPDFRTIADLIERQKAARIAAGRDGCEIWQVRYRDKDCNLVWSPDQRKVVTVLGRNPVAEARP